MKEIVTIAIAITAFALCRQVPNPNFNRVNQCPSQMTSLRCELQADPWFCAQSTPDGWDTCACGQWWSPCLPVNLFGNFAPATSCAGFYSFDNNPTHPDEWIGSPMGLVTGWFKFTASVNVAPYSAYYASPLLVVGDTFPVWIRPVPGWQDVTFYAQTRTPADTVYFGGWAGDTLWKGGQAQSSYLMVRYFQIQPISTVTLPVAPVK